MNLEVKKFEAKRGTDWVTNVTVKHKTDSTFDYTGTTARCLLVNRAEGVTFHDFAPVVNTDTPGQMSVTLTLPKAISGKIRAGLAYGDLEFTLPGGVTVVYFSFSLNLLNNHNAPNA